MIAIFLVPFLLGLLTLFLKGDEHRLLRRNILIGGALIHNALSVLLFWFKWLPFGSYINTDGLGHLFLLVTSFIFTLTSIYSLGYFPLKRRETVSEAGGHVYVSCMLFFLAAMSLTALTLHIGILWIAVEATTLATAPLIYYNQSKRSLEAAWKYLLICSVGIAIALLGIFFIAAACHGTQADLSLPSLVEHAGELNQKLLRMGFIMVLIGFGTKMGLAPMHNWLPDAHSEAPSPISALLSGTLLNCALLGILRIVEICHAAGLDAFTGRLLVIFGLMSLFIAAVFISYQKDYKRLLAYSSIEHMGVIALAIGVGADFAGLLHMVGHSMTKALLFMAAGNIFIMYRTKMVAEVGGLLRTSPATGSLFAVGSLAIIGMPPFLPFISELLVLKKGLDGGHYMAMALYLLFLGIIFVSMSRSTLKMVFGVKRETVWGGLPRTVVVPLMVLAAIVTVFGLYLPSEVSRLIESAASLVGVI